MKIELASEMPKGSPRPGRPDPTGKGYYNFSAGETWSPAVNLYENETTYLVCVDLAGVDKEKIDVVVDGNILSLRGNRQVPTPAGPSAGDAGGRRVRVHVMEIDHGAFCRHVELPHDVAQARIAASYENGMLWIELPKN